MNWIYTPLNEYEIWMNCFFARNNDHLTLSLTDEENLMRWFILDLHTVISDEESRISLFYAGIWIGLAYAGSGRNSSLLELAYLNLCTWPTRPLTSCTSSFMHLFYWCKLVQINSNRWNSLHLSLKGKSASYF
jgi:hypothetical protein